MHVVIKDTERFHDISHPDYKDIHVISSFALPFLRRALEGHLPGMDYVQVSCPHGLPAPLRSVAENKLMVYLFAIPEGIKIVEKHIDRIDTGKAFLMLEGAQGDIFMIDVNDEALSEYGKIMDKKGDVLAVFKDNNLFVTFDLAHGYINVYSVMSFIFDMFIVMRK